MCEIVSGLGYREFRMGRSLPDGSVVCGPLASEAKVDLAADLRPTHELFCHHGDENWEKLPLEEGQVAVCPPGTVLKAVPRVAPKTGQDLPKVSV